MLLNELRARTAGGLHLQIEVEREVPLATSMRHAITALNESVEPLPRRLGKAFAQALRFVPMPSFELPHDSGAVTLGQALATLNHAASAARAYLVVTVDELQYADALGLRSLVTRVHQSAGSDSPILFACAGLPEATKILKELPTYTQRWDHFELGFLTRSEAAAAVRVPIERAGATIDDDALDVIVEEGAGYPAFIQRYASAAWNHHKGKTITLQDALETIPMVRAMVEKLFYADGFAGLSARERLFCKVLADLGPGAHELGAVSGALGVASATISSVRTNLIKKGIVFSPSSGTIAFRIPLADRYIRTHASFFFDNAAQNYMTGLTSRTRT